jgi:hypothetical protein
LPTFNELISEISKNAPHNDFLLVAIGFTFQSPDLNFTWQQRADQWKEFYTAHGRDSKRAENSILQAWCQAIRRKYMPTSNEGDPSLSLGRRSKLTS